MASIRTDTLVQAPAGEVWAALASIGDAHRVFAGVLSESRLERDDLRVATFANGLVVKEQIVDIDPQLRRIAYTVLGDTFQHHNASMRVVAESDSTCRFVWITDVLPHAAADQVRPLMEAGASALKRTLETVAAEKGAIRQ
ncbi:MAG: SRPBCC family protein [Hyphomonadaceae bacterium]|nr:SRPBCC family protein [Hyphomonadaceae bacterium]